SASDSKNVWVKDLTPPVAVARGETAVSLGDTVTFDGSLSNDNVGIVLWHWAI
ncbi:MAG: hypothetical protein GWN18_01380, partial [Thermoplasmata archaeon]|nr:hypothetical protein [Thermoplasmata archaeon]NIS10649.1 hypothetical protein [Thermoplasmata archaeon]NIS18608.1 hypothetical protein [Thermoplasmata archaeon]NIT75599.1 hypothetical protein [Thermoplasmata archaeon]NIU47761.1 hypothetical protein [Thermoplasmata archaeon]